MCLPRGQDAVVSAAGAAPASVAVERGVNKQQSAAAAGSTGCPRRTCRHLCIVRLHHRLILHPLVLYRLQQFRRHQALLQV